MQTAVNVLKKNKHQGLFLASVLCFSLLLIILFTLMCYLGANTWKLCGVYVCVQGSKLGKKND